jgi:hypothetical protein
MCALKVHRYEVKVLFGCVELWRRHEKLDEPPADMPWGWRHAPDLAAWLERLLQSIGFGATLGLAGQADSSCYRKIRALDRIGGRDALAIAMTAYPHLRNFPKSCQALRLLDSTINCKSGKQSRAFNPSCVVPKGRSAGASGNLEGLETHALHFLGSDRSS